MTERTLLLNIEPSPKQYLSGSAGMVGSESPNCPPSKRFGDLGRIY